MKKKRFLLGLFSAGLIITLISAAYLISHPPEPAFKEQNTNNWKYSNPTGQEENGSGYPGGANDNLSPEKEEKSGGAGIPHPVSPSPSMSKAGTFPSILPFLLMAFIVVVIILPTLFVVSSRRTLGERLRRDVLTYLSVFPGATPSALCDEFQLSPSAVNHHIRMLERSGNIFSVRNRKQIHLFPAQFSYSEAVKIADAMDSLGEVNESMMRVVKEILRGAKTRGEIIQRTSIPPSTVSYILKKLVNAHVIGEERNNGMMEYKLLPENIWRVPRLGYSLRGFLQTPPPPEEALPSSPLHFPTPPSARSSL